MASVSGQLSLYGAQQLLLGAFGGTGARPTNFFLALCTAVPTVSMNGSEISEPNMAAGYARATIPNTGTSQWAVDSGWLVSNVNVINFNPATSDWAETDYWALCDALTGGNVWALGQLGTPVQISSGYSAQCPVGALSIELGPFFKVSTN